MNVKKVILLLCLSLLFGCSALLGNDPTFSRERYDNFYMLGNYEGALKRVEERLEKYPKDPFLLNERGYILIEMGRYDEAVNPLNQAIQISDKSVLDSALNNRAAAYNEIGRFEEALDDAKKSINLQPNEPEAYLNMGNALLSLERYSEALTYYDLALDLDAAFAVALYGKGLSLYYLSDFDGALDYLDQYIAINPDDSDAFWYMAYIYDELGEYDNALSYMEKIYQPNSEEEFEVMDYMGLLFANLNLMEESLDIYEQLVSKYPDEPYSYYGKGVALINLGNTKPGIDAIKSAIHLDPAIIELAINDPLLEKVHNHDEFSRMLMAN